MSTVQTLTDRLNGSVAAVTSLQAKIPDLARISDLLCDRLAAGAALYTAGNGGSAAQALHLAEELIGRYRGDRKPLRAICLNADPTALTCIANDYGFEHVFSRQCEALVRQRDVLVALSTSGNSPNIANALRVARRMGGLTIGLLGSSGGACGELCDHAIVVPGSDSAHIQEAHQVIIHLMCEIAETRFRT
jgi:D-sedoheptulose 7-phosphate isomerase